MHTLHDDWRKSHYFPDWSRHSRTVAYWGYHKQYLSLPITHVRGCLGQAIRLLDWEPRWESGLVFISSLSSSTRPYEFRFMGNVFVLRRILCTLKNRKENCAKGINHNKSVAGTLTEFLVHQMQQPVWKIAQHVSTPAPLPILARLHSPPLYVVWGFHVLLFPRPPTLSCYNFSHTYSWLPMLFFLLKYLLFLAYSSSSNVSYLFS